MDPEQLTIRPPREARDFWAYGELVFGRGPIAGVLFYDEYPVNPLDEGADTAASIAEAGREQRGWLFWPVGEEAQPAPDDPWRPRLYLLGSQVTLAAALRRAIAYLEDCDPPTGTYEASADLVQMMLEVDDPELVMVGKSWPE